MRARIAILAALAAGMLSTGSATAAQIQQVTATPSSVAPGQNVTITVKKSGSGNCGARLLLGDGTILGPFGFGQNPQTFSHSYSQGGSYTITAQPKKRGNLAKCAGSAKTTTVTVSGGGTTQKRPQAGGVREGLGKIAPRVEKQPPRRVAPIPPKLKAHEGLKFFGIKSVEVTRRFASSADLHVEVSDEVDQLDLIVEAQGQAPIHKTVPRRKSATFWVEGLHANTRYNYRAIATKGTGKVEKTGSFKTKRRIVQVVIEELSAPDDGDNVTDGDFYFKFTAEGTEGAPFSYDLGTGDVDRVEKNVDFKDVRGDKFALTVEVFEDDTGPQGQIGSSKEIHPTYSFADINERAGTMQQFDFTWDVNKTGHNAFHVIMKGKIYVTAVD